MNSKSPRGLSADLLDYADTPTSLRLRAEMAAVNCFLAGAEMAFEDDGEGRVLTNARCLRRYFIQRSNVRRPAFDLGGRLFGGAASPWWLNLPKHRRKSIRLTGKPVADLDFSCMFARLAYIEAGSPPPMEADLYDGLIGLANARWRPGVKKAVAAMLFSDDRLRRLPDDVASALPPGLTASELRTAIHLRHPALASIFETGIGLRLMFLESQTMVAALLRFGNAGIAALPMHDGCLVPQVEAARAGRIMVEAAEAVTGYPLPVVQKIVPA